MTSTIQFPEKDVQEAYDLAKKALLDRISPIGILAGKTHFSDLWCRDACFASFGALAMSELNAVKTTLSTLLAYMAEDGQIPLRVGQKFLLPKFIGIHSKKLEARFIDDKGVSTVTDSNSLFLITLHNYIDASQDVEFLYEHKETIRNIIEWLALLDEDQDGLLEETSYAGWADSLSKNGNVFYTHILYYQALKSVAYCFEKCNEDGSKYLRRADQLRQKLMATFWNGTYFIDWRNLDSKIIDHFATVGNLLSILFDLTDTEQTESILQYINRHELRTHHTIKSCFPSYPSRHVFWVFRLINLSDYHNGLEWLWLGCLDCAVLAKSGCIDQARAQLLSIARKIMEFKGVYEVYQDGKPVNRLWYKSETWFSWASGMFVWACHKCWDV